MVIQNSPNVLSEGRPARVLIAEDDRTTRTAARVALQLDGYLVAEAPDGCTVLQILAAEAPDVLLLDLDLPGVGGISVLNEIRERRLSIPTLVMTAHRQGGLAGDLMRLGVCGLLHKPLNAADLRLAIHTTLEDRPVPVAAGRRQRELP